MNGNENYDSFQTQRSNMTNQNISNMNGYDQNADGSSTMFGFYSPPQQDFNTDEMRGSMQQILSNNIGEFVVVEFLIGTERLMRKQGILYHVGTAYVTLYDETIRNFIVCDIFSIKFVYFYFPGERPRQNFNLLNGTQPNNSMWNPNNANNMRNMNNMNNMNSINNMNGM